MKESTITVSIRMPEKLFKRLKDAAAKERRSLTAEIILRLERLEWVK